MSQQKIQYFQATGRHKSAVAQVRLIGGSGKITINSIEKTKLSESNPLNSVGLSDKYDLSVIVSGGGFKGQEKAIKLGIARAIVKIDKSLKLTLKKLGLMTRDPRVRERKKYGLKSARRSPQWSKR